MTTERILAALVVANVIITALILLGRWSKTIEKPVTLEKLAWKIEEIGKDIAELRGLIDGRYNQLEQRQNADHVKLRELLTWKAELTVERALRAKQSEEIRAEFRAEVERLKDRLGMPTRRDHDQPRRDHDHPGG